MTSHISCSVGGGRILEVGNISIASEVTFENRDGCL